MPRRSCQVLGAFLSRCPHLHKMIVPSKILTAMKRFDLDMAIRLEIFKVKKTSEAVGGHCVVGGSSIILASQHNRWRHACWIAVEVLQRAPLLDRQQVQPPLAHETNHWITLGYDVMTFEFPSQKQERKEGWEPTLASNLTLYFRLLIQHYSSGLDY